MTTPALDLEALLARRSWLHALARELAGEGADDLVQEAALAALRGSTRPRGPASSWFAGILRHLARREQRRALLRPGLGTPDPRDPTPPTEELLARTELFERLSAAVRALHEPARTVVLLHHFEGLALAEIARRTSQSDSTVRTQHARALAELRERLDRETGGRQTWMALLLAPVGVGPVVLWPWLAAAAALGLAVGGGWWQLRRSAGAVVVDAELTSPSVPRARETTAAEALPKRETIFAETLLVPAASNPLTSCTLTVTILDASGHTVDSKVAYMTLVATGQRKRVGHADEWGRCFFSDLAIGEWMLNAGAHGFRPQERKLLLDAAEVEVEVRLEALWRVEVFAFTPDGTPLRDAVRAADLPDQPYPFANIGCPPDLWPVAHGAGSDVVGAGQILGGEPFWDPKRPGMMGTLVIEAPPPVHVGLTFGEQRVLCQELAAGETSVRLVLDPGVLVRGLATVQGRILAEASALENSWISARDPYGSGSGAEQIAATGEFALGLTPGEYLVDFNIEGHPGWSELVHLAPGQTLDLGTRDPRDCQPRSARVLGPDGQPREAGVWVGVARPGVREIDWSSYTSLSSRASGELELPALGGQPLFLLAHAGESSDRLVSTLIELGTRETPLALEEIRLEPASSLIVLGPGLPANARVEIRTQPEGWLFSTCELGRRLEGRLPPGCYEAVVRDADGSELRRRVFTLPAEGLELRL